jgi:glycosyltransferase involved in cell wall biosynthesis
MNIWFISKYASPPKYSKGPSRLFSLSREIIKLGHNATLITSDANHFSFFPQINKIYNHEVEENVPICWVKTKKYTKTASISRILSWLDFEFKLFFMDLKKLKAPNVVVVSSLSIFTILYGYYLKKKFGSLLVFEIRDIWPLTMTEEGGFTKWHPLVLIIGLIEKFGYKNSDLIIGTMPKLDLHVEKILGYNKPFFCSPLGFDPHNYTQNDLSTQNPFVDLFPQGKIIVGYAGSLGITNALDPFIDTIKLMNDNPSVHFVIVGSGDLRDYFISELTHCKNVTFLDRIKQSEVKYFLDKCDVLYLSTKDSKVWDYGQSMNKVVEYMLASKPIIATYSGFPSMINEAKCGVFINSADPSQIKKEILNLALLSKKERELIGENGKKWIFENRNYPHLAKQYLSVLDLYANSRNRALL